ncbi:MAG: hypothetical protein ACRCX2_27575 [Paraclostridium sp.]
MRISEVVKALELMKENFGDVDVCVEKEKYAFLDVKDVINARFADKSNEGNFIVITDISRKVTY